MHSPQQQADDSADDAQGRAAVSDVNQEQHQHPAVPVRLDGPVETLRLPARHTIPGSFTAGLIAEHAQFKTDPRRSRIQILSITNAIYVGTNQTAANEATGALIPAGIWTELNCKEALWIRAETAETVVSYFIEQWTD